MINISFLSTFINGYFCFVINWKSLIISTGLPLFTIRKFTNLELRTLESAQMSVYEGFKKIEESVFKCWETLNHSLFCRTLLELD